MKENEKSTESKCIIVCAGEFVPVEIKRSREDLVIAADGGYENCRMVSLEPDLVIGDFDSVSESSRMEILRMQEEEPERVISYPSEKDDTDTMAAIRIGLERGCRKFYLYGAAGGRMDHMMANIQCLIYLKNQQAKGYIMCHDMMMTVIRDETITFHASMRGLLSLFSMGEKAEGITLENMKYPLNEATVTNDYPIGISNEFTEKAGSVCVRKGTLLVMVYWKDRQ